MTGIVVGLDDAPDARAALHWAFAEAVLRCERLTVVTVVNELPVAMPALYAMDAAGRVPDIKKSTCRWAHRLTTQVAAQTPGGTDVPFDVEVTGGNPAKELIKRSRDASLLVVGRQGLNPVTRLFAGSVSTAVVHRASCPVVVVTHPTRRAGRTTFRERIAMVKRGES